MQLSPFATPPPIIIRPGWTTFPLLPFTAEGCVCRKPKCAGAGKHPAVMWGKDSLAAGTQIPIPYGYGIGLATGSRSGVMGVDLDRKNGLDGLEALRVLAKEKGGTIPNTLVTMTPTTGYHLLFKDPGIVFDNSASVVGPGIDIRSDGGYLVLPPSMHKCGGRYVFLDPYAEIAEMPQWLIDAILHPPKTPRRITRQHLEKLAKRWRRNKSSSRQELGEVLQKICLGESFALPGERDTTIFKITQDLSKEYPDADPETIAELFAPSLDIMAREDPEAPTVDDVLEKLGRALGEPETRLGPEIYITADMKSVVDQAEMALARSGELYRRGDTIVREVVDAEPPPEMIRETGTPTIKIVPPAAIRERLSIGARWVTGDDVRTLPPPWVVESLVARTSWKLWPLEVITETPVLRPNSCTILDTPGYDIPTGILYRPKTSYPRIPEAPTQQDIYTAVMVIEDILYDFRFETLEHKAGFYAAILTPLARTAFSGPSPLFLFDASTPGSGKSLLALVASIIATGRYPAIVQFPKDEDERKKAITTYALEGDRIVTFDNVTGKLGGTSLCTALTLPTWTDRILGQSRQWTGPMNIVFYATSNNAQLGADMDRRATHIRIDPGCEDPEKRTGFRYPDLLATVRARQPVLTAAALTILRGFVAAGRPRLQYEPWGSYESWADLVIGALRYAGFPDIGTARAGLADSDPETEHRLALVNGWAELCKDKPQGITAREGRSLIYPDRIWQQPHPRLSEAFEALLYLQKQEVPSSARVAGLLRNMAGRMFNGRKIIALGKNGTDSKLWGVR